MHPTATILFLAFPALASPATGQTPVRQEQTSCWATALTQAAMNQCAVAEFRRAEEEMSGALRELLARAAAARPAAVPKIKAAQASWGAYVEAQIDAMYAAEEKQEHYGTVYPMCVQMLRTKLIAQRTAVHHSPVTSFRRFTSPGGEFSQASRLQSAAHPRYSNCLRPSAKRGQTESPMPAWTGTAGRPVAGLASDQS